MANQLTMAQAETIRTLHRQGWSGRRITGGAFRLRVSMVRQISFAFPWRVFGGKGRNIARCSALVCMIGEKQKTARVNPYYFDGQGFALNCVRFYWSGQLALV